MPIEYVKGDVREQPFNSNYRVIAHVCNDQGLMGGGVAKALYTKWPRVKEKYLRFCEVHDNPLGINCWVTSVEKSESKVTHVLNMIAQHKIRVRRNENGIAVGEDGRPPLRYGALAKCMFGLNDVFNKDDDVEIHCPKFGSDLAGGNWSVIESMIEEIWRDFRVVVCTID